MSDIFQELGAAHNPRATAGLIDRTFHEGQWDQYKRELVQNSIDAGATRIQLTMVRLKGSKGLKRAFVDNGCGMSADKLPKYLGQLFSGESDASINGLNFQMGARVSTLPFNHGGLLVASWTKDDPEGSMIEIVYDKDKKIYGTRAFIDDDTDDRSEVTVPYEWLKHPFIKTAGQGTIYVLMGDNIDTHTFGEIMSVNGEIVYPTAYSGRDDWHYLSTKWWKLPKDTELSLYWAGASGSEGLDKLIRSTSEGVIVSKREFPHCYFRNVKGLNVSLNSPDAHGQRGSVKVKGATIYWTLFPEKLPGEGKDNKHQGSGEIFDVPLGLFAEKLGNELYNIKKGKDVREMEWYGITHSNVRSRLVLIVEPDSDAQPNSARSKLMLGGNPELPHREWGEDFYKNIPKVIEKRIKECRGESYDPDSSKFIRNFLKRLKDLYPAALRAASRGKYLATSVEDVTSVIPDVGTGDHKKSHEKTKTKKRHGESTGTALGNGYMRDLKGVIRTTEYEERPKEIKSRWVADGVHLANYNETTRDLTLNPEHFIVKSLEERAVETRSTTTSDIVREYVRKAIQEHLEGHILSVQFIQKRLDKDVIEEGPRKFLENAVSKSTLLAICSNMPLLDKLINEKCTGIRGIGKEK